ncbi:hypothetical protein ACWEKM_08030 [Streptomyces sp. NPDC004752]
MQAEPAKKPEAAGWSDDGLLMPAHRYVDQMLNTASLFPKTLQAPDASEAERERVIRGGDPPTPADRHRPAGTGGTDPHPAAALPGPATGAGRTPRWPYRARRPELTRAPGSRADPAAQPGPTPSARWRAVAEVR